jgi:hypothetical protein
MSDYLCKEEYDAAMEGEAQEAAQAEADACEGEALAEQQNIESARHALQQLKAEIAAQCDVLEQYTCDINLRVVRCAIERLRQLSAV